MRYVNLAVFVLTTGVLRAGPVAADETSRTISVTGQGKATSPPDMATIHTGVITQAETASEALSANNDAMEGIMSVLEEHHIASKDIQTSSFSVSPEYERNPQGRTSPNLVGYRVTNQVRVGVHNLPDLGQVLDALVGAGSNQVSGISFGIDDPTGILNQARNRSIADARSRAELYAQPAGVAVGEVLTISEQGAQVPQPEFFARAGAARGGVPVATGVTGTSADCANGIRPARQRVNTSSIPCAEFHPVSLADAFSHRSVEAVPVIGLTT